MTGSLQIKLSAIINVIYEILLTRVNLYCRNNATMIILVKDLAFVQAGYPFREKIVSVADGEYSVVQIKDIDANGFLSKDLLLQTEIKNVRPEFELQKDDVLFTTRGANRRACYVGDKLPETVFVSQIFALRKIGDSVLPAYLAWYINQKSAQDYFEAQSSGSHIQNVRKSVLENLPVEIPSLETQRKILEVYNLTLREKSLVELIRSKREKIVGQILLNAVNIGER